MLNGILQVRRQRKCCVVPLIASGEIAVRREPEMQIVERDKRTDFTASSERCQQGLRGGIQIVKIADHRDPRTRG